MARKSKHDIAKAKAAKQKKIAIGGSVLLVLLLAYEVPKTMKMMSKHSPAAIASSTTSTTTPPTSGAPAIPSSLAAPSLAGTTPTTTAAAASSQLVAAVPMEVDPGQLETFQRFASKDPFSQGPSTSGSGTSAPAGGASPGPGGPGAGSGSGGKTSPAPTPKPPTPPAPAPAAAVISLNGELMTVAVDTDFPTSGKTFEAVGSPLFHLVSLTRTTARIGIAGGRYANGVGTITLHLRAPVTLQNTADGSKYVLVLEPQGTQVGPVAGGGTVTSPTATTPSSTASVVPSSGG